MPLEGLSLTRKVDDVSMITFKQTGDFSKTQRAFEKMREVARKGILDKYGKEGVMALSTATPNDSGETANSWVYKITTTAGQSSITFYNTHVNNGVNVAIILQYGHGTGTGGWVEGRDYINPAIRPVFDKIVDSVWKEVTHI